MAFINKRSVRKIHRENLHPNAIAWSRNDRRRNARRICVCRGSRPRAHSQLRVMSSDLAVCYPGKRVAYRHVSG